MKIQKDDEKYQHIFSALDNIQFGCVTITIHEGEITQVDVTEKKRFQLQKNSEKKRLKAQ